KPQLDALACAHRDAIVGGGLGPDLLRIHRLGAAMHQVVVDAVLDPAAAVGRAEEALVVGLVLREDERRVLVAEEIALAQLPLPPSRPSPRCSRGFAAPLPLDHVLRNHSVGSTCSVAACGPRFATVISTRMSSGEPFAYSTNTSK